MRIDHFKKIETNKNLLSRYESQSEKLGGELKNSSLFNSLKAELNSLVQKIPDDKFFENILTVVCLGASAKNTKYEGAPQLPSMTYMAELAKKIQAKKLPFCQSDKIAELVTTTDQLANEGSDSSQVKAASAMQRIMNLEKGESLAINTGYSSVPAGHSMLARFIKTSSPNEPNSYSIYLYDASGAEGFDALIGETIEHKTRIRPYLEFEHVTDQDLFFDRNDPLILTNLYRLNEPSDNREVDKHWTISMFCPLQHRWVNKSFADEQRWISPQRSGNCVKKSYFAMAAHIIDSRQDFKCFSLDTRLATLVACMAYLEDKRSIEPHQLVQMREACSAFTNQLESSQQQGFIDSDGAKVAFATIQELLTSLESIPVVQVQTPSVTKKAFELAPPVQDRAKLADALRNIPPAPAPTNGIQQAWKIDLVMGSTCTSWKEFEHTLNGSYLQKISLISSPALQAQQIEIYMWQLRHLKNQPVELEPFQSIALLRSLDRLLTLYTQASNAAHSPTYLASHNTVMEITALAFMAAKAWDQDKILDEYGLDFEPYQALSETALFAVVDTKLLDQRNDLITFFSSLPSEKLFNFSTSFRDKELIQRCQTPNTKIYSQYYKKKNQVLSAEGAVKLNHSFTLPDFMAHLQILKSMQLEVTACFGLGHPKDEVVSNRDRWAQGYGQVIFQAGGRKWVPGDKNWLLTQLTRRCQIDYPIDASTLQTLEKSGQTSHFSNKLQSQNRLIAQSSPEQYSSLWPYLLALSDPDVSITNLLRAATENIHDLLNKEIRVLWENFLFKTIDQDGVTTSPLMEALRHDPEIIRKLDSLAEEALRAFSSVQQPLDPNTTSALLSVVRTRGILINHWRDFHPGEPLGEKSLKLNQKLLAWGELAMKQSHANKPLIRELRLAKVLLLLPEPSSDLIITYLNLSSLNELNADWEDLPALHYCHRRWNSCVLRWAQPKESSWQQICEEILRNLVAPDAKVTTAYISDLPDGISAWEENSGNRYDISLTGREIFRVNGSNKESILSSGNSKSQILSSSKFKRLFGDRAQETQQSRNVLTFHDALWGAIQIVETPNEIEIYRTVGKAVYRYLDPSVFNPGYPRVLIQDHACWLANGEIYAYDLQTGLLRYKINAQGELYHAAGGELCLQLSSTGVQEALLAFEDRQGICLYQQGASYRIELPRFQSNGEQLRFDYDPQNQVWRYGPDPRFYLVAKPEEGIGVSRCLYLEDDKGEKWILIPQGRILAAGYSPSCGIELPPIDIDGNSIDYFLLPLDSSRKPIGKKAEELVYIALLYLASKQYKLCKQTIDQIGLNGLPSTGLWNLFKLHISTDYHDRSPNACALHLHLFLHLFQLDPLAEIFQNNAELWKELEKAYKTYHIGFRRVQHPLQLTPAQERSLLKAIPYLEPQFKEALNQSLNGKLRHVKWQSPHSVQMQYKFLEGYNPKLQQLHDTIRSDLGKITTNFESVKKISEATSAQFKTAYASLIDPKAEDKPYLLYKTATLSDREFPPEEREMLVRAAMILSRGDALLPLPAEPYPKEALEKWGNWFLENFKQSQNHEKPKPTFTRLNFPTGVEFKKQPEFKDAAQPVESVELSSWYSSDWEKTGPLDERDEEQIEWKNDYLLPGPATERPKPIPAKLINLPSVRNYHQVIETRRDHYQKDQEFALGQSQQKSLTKEMTRLVELQGKVETARSESKAREEQAASLVDKLANLAPANAEHFLQHQMRQLGQTRSKISVDTICRKAVRRNYLEAIKQLNPHLSDEEIHQLRDLTIDYMTEKTHRIHLERILEPLTAYIQGGDADENLLSKASEQLNCERPYTPADEPFLLLFDYFSARRVRLDQKTTVCNAIRAILQKNGDNESKSEGFAFQKALAGGKSSVIIPALVEIACEEGYLATVSSHHSQHAAVRGNLPGHMAPFGKQVVEMDFTLADLGNVKKLEVIKARLLTARTEKCPVHWKSTQSQILRLKFKLLCRSFVDLDAKSRAELLPQLQLLAEINAFLKKYEIKFLDEGDVQLSLSTTVIIPSGNPVTLTPERAEPVAMIYTLLLDPEVKEKIKLLENRQDELSPAQFEAEVLSYLAQKLTSFSPFLLYQKPELERAFQRFISGQIDHDDQHIADNPQISTKDLQGQTQENVRLLRWLAKLSRSSNSNERMAADLIALSKQICKRILPITLANKYHRGYGPDPDHDNGSICPHRGVRVPATTKFGNVYTALAYSFQACLGGGISEGEIRFLASKMSEAARFYAKQERKAWLDTEEAIQFKKLTQIGLDEVEHPEAFAKAHAYINDLTDPRRRIAVRQEVAPFHISYYPDTVESDPISFLEGCNKAVTCSGTLWNSSAFHQRVGTPDFEKGAEGSVLNLLLSRAQSAPNQCLNEIPRQSLSELLTLIKAHEKGREVRGIIDSGGYCLDGPTPEMASTILQELPHLKAVVYMRQFSLADQQKYHCNAEEFVLQKADGSWKVLQSNTREGIEQHNVRLEDTLFFFDELRATGTDFVLPDRAVFFQTIDPRQSLRTLMQGALRARQLFKQQHIELVLTKQGREEMLNRGENPDDIFQTLLVNEAVAAANETFSSYLKHCKSALEVLLFNRLTEAAIAKDGAQIAEISSQFDSLLLNHELDQPWKQYGKILEEKSPVEIIQSYQEELLKKVEAIDSTLAQSLQEPFAKILLRAKADPYLPDKVAANQAEKLDTQMQLEVDVEVQVAREEASIELTTELQVELNSYQTPLFASPYEEVPPPFTVSNGKLSLAGLSTHLSQLNKVTPQKYSSLVSDNLWMTNNLRYTLNQDMPIFHKKSKECHFLLAVQEPTQEKPQFILCSDKDASFWKKMINTEHPTNVQLYSLEGYLEAGEPVAKTEEFEEGLWRANFFAGHINYLEDRADLSKTLIGNQKLLAGDYLKLKTAHNMNRLKAVCTSHLVDNRSVDPSRLGILVFGARRERLRELYRQLYGLTQQEVGLVPPDGVKQLLDGQLKWLVKKEQIEQVSDDKVNFLDPTHVKWLSPARQSLLTAPQLVQEIRDVQLLEEALPDQVPGMSAKQRVHLKRIEQLARVPDPNGLTLLQQQMLKKLVNTPPYPIPQPWMITLLCFDNLDKVARTPEQLQHLTILQLHQLKPKHESIIQKLAKSQITHLNVEALQKISPNLVCDLDVDLLKRLKNVDLLKRVPAQKAHVCDLRSLTADEAFLLVTEAPHFSDEVFAHRHLMGWRDLPPIEQDCIDKIKQTLEVYFDEIGGAKLLAKLPNLFPWHVACLPLQRPILGEIAKDNRLKVGLTTAQLLSIEDDPGLTPEQEKGLFDFNGPFDGWPWHLNYVRPGIAAEGLEKFHSKYSDIVSEAQIKKWDRTHPHWIDNFLTADQLGYLSDETLNTIDLKKVDLMNTPTLKRLRNPSLLAAIPPDRLSEVGDIIPTLSHEALKELISRQPLFTPYLKIDSFTQDLLRSNHYLMSFLSSKQLLYFENDPGIGEDQAKQLAQYIANAEETHEAMPPTQPWYVKHFKTPERIALIAKDSRLKEELTASQLFCLKEDPGLTPQQKRALYNWVAGEPSLAKQVLPWQVPYVPLGLVYEQQPDFVRDIPRTGVREFSAVLSKISDKDKINELITLNSDLAEFLSPAQLLMLRKRPLLSSSQEAALQAHLTNIGKQLLWAEPWVVPYLDTTVLNGITLTKKLVGELSDQQLANLSSEVNVIQRLSPSQIDKIGDEALQNLTPVQVRIASDNALRRLKNPTLLVQVPMSKIHLLPIEAHEYLSDVALNRLYPRKNRSFVKNLARTAFAINIQLPFWLVANSLKLGALTPKALVSKTGRRQWSNQLDELIIFTPMRKIIMPMQLWNYPAYIRSSTRWSAKGSIKQTRNKNLVFAGSKSVVKITFRTLGKTLQKASRNLTRPFR